MHSFDGNAFAQWLAGLDEPDWLKHQRQAALDAYQSLPLPQWKYTEAGDIDLSVVAPVQAAVDEAAALRQVPDEVRAVLDSKTDAAGVIVQAEGGTVACWLADEAKSQGVVLSDLATAVREHPDLVKQYLFSRGPQPAGDKFIALNAALWQTGLFLYVPKGVNVEQPIYFVQTIGDGRSASLPHNLVIVDENASAVLFEEQAAATAGSPYNGAESEFYLEQGAQLQYYVINRWSEDVNEVSRRHAFVGRDATFNAVAAMFGGRQVRTVVQADLVGNGASSEIIGLVLSAREQVIDLTTETRHQAPHTSGQMLVKQVLRGNSLTAFQGNIVIEQNAKHSQNYLQENAMILDDGARAYAIPGLEIYNDEVAATHGATIGRVDETEVFYLMSRGLSRNQAELLLVTGFFDPLLRNIPGDATRERLADLIVEKVKNA